MKDTIVRKEFVRRILENESERLMKWQSIAMRRYLTFHTGETERSREVSVSSSDSMDGKLSFSANAHIRFLDIKRKTFRIKDGRASSIKRRRIFNQVIMRQYNGIAMRLMYDLTDEVAEEIKKDFQKAVGNG